MTDSLLQMHAKYQQDKAMLSELHISQWIKIGGIGKLVKRDGVVRIEACPPEENNNLTIFDYDLARMVGIPIIE